MKGDHGAPWAGQLTLDEIKKAEAMNNETTHTQKTFLKLLPVVVLASVLAVIAGEGLSTLAKLASGAGL